MFLFFPVSCVASEGEMSHARRKTKLFFALEKRARAANVYNLWIPKSFFCLVRFFWRGGNGALLCSLFSSFLRWLASPDMVACTLTAFWKKEKGRRRRGRRRRRVAVVDDVRNNNTNKSHVSTEKHH